MHGVLTYTVNGEGVLELTNLVSKLIKHAEVQTRLRSVRRK